MARRINFVEIYETVMIKWLIMLLCCINVHSIKIIAFSNSWGETLHFLWFENRYRVMNTCFFFQSKQKARFSAQKGEKSYRNTAWIKNIGDYAESQYARLTVGVIPRCQYTKHFSESWANSVWTVWFENQVQLSFKSL